MTISEFRKLSTDEKAAAFDPSAVGGYNVYDRALFATLQIWKQEYVGCCTPGEELIWDLILEYGIRPLTPERVAKFVESFEDDHSDAIRDAKKVIAEYPEEVGIVDIMEFAHA